MHNFFLVFPSGARPPLYPYVCALVWWMFPFLKGLVMQRIGSCVISFVTIWLLYRLGREVSGKRLVGLLLAALGAASKPFLIQVIMGYGGLTLVFAVTLFLIFQFRVFKRPDLARFLQWGAIMALGLHTYTAAVPWLPFLVLINLGFLFWKRQNEPVEKTAIAVTLLFIFVYLLFYLDHMAFIFHDNPVSKLWASSSGVWMLLQSAFLGALVYGYRNSKETGRRLCAFGLGVLLFSFICYPLSMNMGGAGRIAEQSILPKTIGALFTSDFIGIVRQQAGLVFLYVFNSGGERSDMNVLGDPFFDYQAVVVVLLGLIYAAVRPTWTKSFLFLCGLVGTVPYFLTGDHQSAKFCGTIPPFLLLGSMALGQGIETGWNSSRKTRWMGVFLAFTFCGFWVWEINTTRERVYVKWWNEVQNDDVCVGREVDKALPNKRVYLTPITVPHSGHFYDGMTQSALHDDQAVYTLKDVNVIAVKAEEKRKDVMVIVSPLMKNIVKRLKKEFPSAQWTPAWQYYQISHDEVPFLYSVIIPAAEIPERSGKLFQFKVVPSQYWYRMIYFYRMCFREGVIESEDASPTLNPPPPEASAKAISARGEWEAPADGKYTFSMNYGEYSRLCVDDKTVLTTLRGDSHAISKTLRLKKGIHSIKYATYLITAGGFGDVTIQNSALNYKMVLGAIEK